MASTTITRDQQVQIQLAIYDRISLLSKTAKGLEKLGLDSADERERIKALKDADAKLTQFSEWEIETCSEEEN